MENVAGGDGRAGECGLFALLADSCPLTGVLTSSALAGDGVPPRVGEEEASVDCGDGLYVCSTPRLMTKPRGRQTTTSMTCRPLMCRLACRD